MSVELVHRAQLFNTHTQEEQSELTNSNSKRELVDFRVQKVFLFQNRVPKVIINDNIRLGFTACLITIKTPKEVSESQFILNIQNLFEVIYKDFHASLGLFGQPLLTHISKMSRVERSRYDSFFSEAIVSTDRAYETDLKALVAVGIIIQSGRRHSEMLFLNLDRNFFYLINQLGVDPNYLIEMMICMGGDAANFICDHFVLGDVRGKSDLHQFINQFDRVRLAQLFCEHQFELFIEHIDWFMSDGNMVNIYDFLLEQEGPGCVLTILNNTPDAKEFLSKLREEDSECLIMLLIERDQLGEDRKQELEELLRLEAKGHVKIAPYFNSIGHEIVRVCDIH